MKDGSGLIKKMKLEIKHALGVNPDSLLITEDIFNALTENATILARLRCDADKELTFKEINIDDTKNWKDTLL